MSTNASIFLLGEGFRGEVKCQRDCQILSSSSHRLDSKELGTGRWEREESRAKEQKESEGSDRCEMSQYPDSFGRKS